jgi:hypothetical protein
VADREDRALPASSDQTRSRTSIARFRAVPHRSVGVEARLKLALFTRRQLGRARFRSAQVHQKSIFSAISMASSISMPRYLTVLSTFRCPSKKSHGPEVPSAAIDQRSLGPPQRVRLEL